MTNGFKSAPERVSPELLRALLRYEPETGALFWRERPASMFGRAADQKTWNKRFAGKPALTAIGNGYRQDHILYGTFGAHRVAWAIMTGEWPKGEVDHINGVPSDNRWCNLRLATHAENGRNAKVRADNTSGFKGVTLSACGKRWQARIKQAGRRVHIGTFATPEEAHAAYCKASAELHGEYGRVS